MSERTVWHDEMMDTTDSEGYPIRRKARVQGQGESGNLVSSLTTEGTHKPVIDFDFECQLLPSKTPGHFHLYIEKEISWEQYRQILDALLNADLIQEGWYDSAIVNKKSFVRHPLFYLSDEKEKMENY